MRLKGSLKFLAVLLWRVAGLGCVVLRNMFTYVMNFFTLLLSKYGTGGYKECTINYYVANLL